MKIALGQINPVVADIPGNRERILENMSRAREAGAELILFPEMSLIGYPPMDLLENRRLIDDNLDSLETIAEASQGIAAVVGFVDRDEQGNLQNAAAFVADGRIMAVQAKRLLPSYDVFDEVRYFLPAGGSDPVSHNGASYGLTICEDIWNPDFGDAGVYMENRRYDHDPAKELAEKGCDFILNLSASPYVMGKHEARKTMLSNIARLNGIPVVHVNQVGGNDSLIFDGGSLAFNSEGECIAAGAFFQEDLVVFDTGGPAVEINTLEPMEEVHRALVLGLGDYMRKCGFKQAVVGLSGGIDSALTATLAADALEPGNVLGITMPSEYSSRGSLEDSEKLARNLGIQIEKISIQRIFDMFRKELEPLFRGMEEDVTEENIQARIRGTLLMALSNKTGRILLTTGNKSELAMGYCTLYGDMAGGLAVISDLPKTLVFSLSRHLNREKERIPEETLTKPPSAELKPGQKDEDSLPPYDILDGILELYIEDRLSSKEIIEQGYDPGTVDEVLKAVNRNEYKRQQAPPGLKITSKAFGSGRRIPIAQKFQP
jgi:NAD+ synthetase